MLAVYNACGSVALTYSKEHRALRSASLPIAIMLLPLLALCTAAVLGQAPPDSFPDCVNGPLKNNTVCDTSKGKSCPGPCRPRPYPLRQHASGDHGEVLLEQHWLPLFWLVSCFATGSLLEQPLPRAWNHSHARVPRLNEYEPNSRQTPSLEQPR